MKRFMDGGLLVVTGCSSPRLPPPAAPHNVPVWTEATRVEETSPPPVMPPGDGVLIPVDSPTVPHAGQASVKTGTAPPISKTSSGFLPYAVGLSQPTVDCPPFHLTEVEREPGEEMSDLAAGDQERGSLRPVRSGPPGTRARHVRLTHTDDTRDLATATVSGTNRRVSRSRLVSRRTSDLVTARFSGGD